MTYKIEYSVDTNIQMDTISYPADSYTVTGLMKGTYYSVHVALHNSAGDGVYSSSEIGRTAVDRELTVSIFTDGQCLNDYRERLLFDCSFLL